MTTQQAAAGRTTARTPRPAPAGRGPRVPGAAVRRRRGPSPPDAIILALQRAAGAHTDAATPAGWGAAVAAAVGDLVRWARRGVTRALTGPARAAAQAAPTPPAAAGTGARIQAAVAAATPAAVNAAIETVVLSEHAGFVEHFATASGSKGYIWTTQDDELVRHLHAELEGTFHTWAAPPVSGTDGFRGHPGEPANCRCIAFPR